MASFAYDKQILGQLTRKLHNSINYEMKLTFRKIVIYMNLVL